MEKPSNVAVCPVPPMNAIAVPAAEIVPPPVAAMVAPLPWSATAAAEAFVVLTARGPVTVIFPADPLARTSLATSPNAPGPEVVIFADPRLICEPAPSAPTPAAGKPVASDTPPAVVIEVDPVAEMTPP